MVPIIIAKLRRSKYSKIKPGVWLVFCVVIFIISYSIYCILHSTSTYYRQDVELVFNSTFLYPLPLHHHDKDPAVDIMGGRILCHVPISMEKIKVAKLIRETWGSKCDELVFYGNFATDSIPEKYRKLKLNIKMVNVTERYDLLWGKTKATLVQLYHDYGNKFDWFLKADDDTFVILENLRRFIQGLKAEDDKNRPLWFGYKMKHKKMKNGYMSGGAGYVMNAKALSKFALFVENNKHQDFVQYDPSIMERPEGCKTVTDEGIEDLELGRCFHSLGIEDVPTQDSLGRHRFLPLSLSTLMSGIHSGHWIWSQSWYPLKLVNIYEDAYRHHD